MEVYYKIILMGMFAAIAALVLLTIITRHRWSSMVARLFIFVMVAVIVTYDIFFIGVEDPIRHALETLGFVFLGVAITQWVWR